MTKQFSKKLQEACEWIAFNDEPGLMDIVDIACSIPVAMLADVYKEEENDIAKKIIEIRKQQGK